MVVLPCLYSMCQAVNYTYNIDFGSDTMKINNYNFEFIGKRVQQARKAKRYTQAELAEMIDMSAKNLSCLERGTTGISIPTLMTLCKALEVSADYILFGNEAGERQSTVSILLSKLPEQKQHQAEKLLDVFVEAYTE